MVSDLVGAVVAGPGDPGEGKEFGQLREPVAGLEVGFTDLQSGHIPIYERDQGIGLQEARPRNVAEGDACPVDFGEGAVADLADYHVGGVDQVRVEKEGMVWDVHDVADGSERRTAVGQ